MLKAPASQRGLFSDFFETTIKFTVYISFILTFDYSYFIVVVIINVVCFVFSRLSLRVFCFTLQS